MGGELCGGIRSGLAVVLTVLRSHRSQRSSQIFLFLKQIRIIFHNVSQIAQFFQSPAERKEIKEMGTQMAQMAQIF